MLEKLRKRGQ